jgi:hypothetical protein
MKTINIVTREGNQEVKPSRIFEDLGAKWAIARYEWQNPIPWKRTGIFEISTGRGFPLFGSDVPKKFDDLQAYFSDKLRGYVKTPEALQNHLSEFEKIN